MGHGRTAPPPPPPDVLSDRRGASDHPPARERTDALRGPCWPGDGVWVRASPGGGGGIRNGRDLGLAASARGGCWTEATQAHTHGKTPRTPPPPPCGVKSTPILEYHRKTWYKSPGLWHEKKQRP